MTRQEADEKLHAQAMLLEVLVRSEIECKHILENPFTTEEEDRNTLRLRAIEEAITDTLDQMNWIRRQVEEEDPGA